MDLLAWHIIAHVDESPFGGHGHNQDGARTPTLIPLEQLSSMAVLDLMSYLATGKTPGSLLPGTKLWGATSTTLALHSAKIQ
ncbi:hypothetical protein FRC10_005550, partial [Ceratobasidium sp. 414]